MAEEITISDLTPEMLEQLIKGAAALPQLLENQQEMAETINQQTAAIRELVGQVKEARSTVTQAVNASNGSKPSPTGDGRTSTLDNIAEKLPASFWDSLGKAAGDWIGKKVSGGGGGGDGDLEAFKKSMDKLKQFKDAAESVIGPEQTINQIMSAIKLGDTLKAQLSTDAVIPVETAEKPHGPGHS